MLKQFSLTKAERDDARRQGGGHVGGRPVPPGEPAREETAQHHGDRHHQARRTGGPGTPGRRRTGADARLEHCVLKFCIGNARGGALSCDDASPVLDADGRLLGVTRMLHVPDYEGFHEQGYYAPGDRGAPVYDTRAGRIGIAICYDRHYPEYMRALAVAGAELVVVPQAGAVGEWPDGLYEAEMQVAAFQNGYFVALCNRVGAEEKLEFAGESYICDQAGRVVARAASREEQTLAAELDLARAATSHARRLFLRDRRPELYGDWLKGR